MKKTLLFLLPLFCVVALQAQTPQCMRDSSVLQDPAVFVSPPTYNDTAANPVYALAVACIGQPYAQSITVEVPTTFTQSGFTIMINNVTAATTGAVTGLPTGITYSCDPPNCIFNANTLGCILLYGTPTDPAQAPDTTELKINVTLNGTIFGQPASIPLEVPKDIAPNHHYYMILNTMANGSSAVYDLNSQVSGLKNVPNPFTNQTSIEVQSRVAGTFRFEVFDLLGQHVYDDKIRLEEGANQFTFDAGNLANGTYYFSIGNADGKVTRMMVVTR